ncbi:oligosaccharide flippase family protein [Acinetobacter terrestris]|uniref:oligosaccharide flippase family protein n=1 Tax=Acinetobacter terrestris TaxID=2529843 RepID=UPI00103DD9C0|nr:oligosaccharide flippase family protein [Acinetobacter terrestris]TCB65705.1 hypothetical protein E0H81_06495 [Acinetobacter terrestris]
MRNNSLIVKNSVFLAIRTIVITLVGLYSVRELLIVLGIEEYGLFNLVFGIAVLFSFINGAMISSTQRYLAYYIGKKDEKMVNEVWANSLMLHIGIGIFIFILLFVLKDFILIRFLVVDYKFINTAYFIYYCSIMVVLISIIQSPFNALILAKEKMSFFAFLSLLDAIMKLCIIYFLYIFESYILEKYALMFVASSLIIFLIYYLYCSKKIQKKIQLRQFKPKLLKEMLLYSLWNVFGNFAFVTKTQGINVVLNIFVGVVANSAYTITANVSSAIGNLVNSIVTAINPQIYKSYAEKNFERYNLLINTSSKFSFFLGLIVVLPILFNTKYLLIFWLNQLPLYLVSFVQLALIILLVDCLSGSLMTGIQATGKIKLYQVVVSLFVFLNLPLSYYGLKIWNQPIIVYWIALLIALISLALRLYFISRLINFSILLYLKSVILKVIFVILSSFVLASFVTNIVDVDNDFLSFLLVSVLIVFSVILSIVMFGFRSSERQFLFSKISGYLK